MLGSADSSVKSLYDVHLPPVNRRSWPALAKCLKWQKAWLLSMAIDNIDGVDSMKTGTTNGDLVQSTALHRQSVRLALKGECDFLLILLNFLYPSCSAVDFFNQPDCFRPERLLNINLGHIVRTFELLWCLDHFWIIVIPKKLVSRLNRGGVEVLLSTWTLPDCLLGDLKSAILAKKNK